MESAYHTLNLAYGPYRLKATYQRNMLLAMGATTGLVTLAVALGAILLGSPSTPASTPGNRDAFGADTIVVRLSLPPTVEPPIPNVKPSHPKPTTIDRGVFTPVADSVLTDQDSAIPYTPGGTTISNPGDSGVIGGGDDLGGIGSLDTGEYLPPIDTFIIVERQPELIFSVTPEYPRWLKEAGIEGEVVIKALVGRKGDVLDAAVFVSSGNKLLDEAALAVAGKYKYQPAVQNGRPLAIWVTYKVLFKLAR